MIGEPLMEDCFGELVANVGHGEGRDASMVEELEMECVMKMRMRCWARRPTIIRCSASHRNAIHDDDAPSRPHYC